jgi:SET domain-containing protein
MPLRRIRRIPRQEVLNEEGEDLSTHKPTHSWLNPKLQVRPSRAHETGVFACEPISQGERLAILGGEIMLIDEINDLPERLQDYPMQIEERFVLGSRSALEPEDTDFFNHSCDPNAGFKGQIFLVAMRPIVVGEEVTFDYAMVVSQSVGSAVVFEMDCLCGARQCRRTITETDWQLPHLQKRYGGYFSQYIQDKIDAEEQVVGRPWAR